METPKRQRSSKTIAERIPLQERPRHSILWFEDGSVILATETMLFRVHRSILSLNSTVFSGMFSLPQPKHPEEGETMENLPVVHLFDDEADVTHLLKALYYRTYYNNKLSEENLSTFEVIAGILRMSTKYEIEHLHQETLEHLASRCPDSLYTFDKDYPQYLCAGFDPFATVALARETHAYRLLPVAFYYCAASPIEDVLNSIYHGAQSKAPLCGSDLQICLMGREELMRANQEMIWKFLFGSSHKYCLEKASCIEEKKDFLASDSWKSIAFSPDPLNCVSLGEFTAYRREMKLCYRCADAAEACFELGRNRVFDKLPALFGLPDWSTLLKTSAA